jgi:hypothetical protein
MAILCWIAHGSWHLLNGHPEHALWACHVGTLAVGLGMILGWPEGTGAGLLWLSVGVPMWIYAILTGEAFIPTAALTHVGGAILGIVGARDMGFSRGTWWKAGAGLAALNLLCRSITPPAENVNLAFSVWPGWERLFPSHLLYLLVVFALCLGVFRLVEAALREETDAVLPDRQGDGAGAGREDPGDQEHLPLG